jgi:two-component system chemotaxis response regulator CheB
MPRTRVLVVDNSTTIRAMAHNLLQMTGEVEVVGTARDAAEAAVLIDRLDPDVVTLDTRMAGTDGLDFLSALMATHRRQVIMVSGETQLGSRAWNEAIRRGAAACFDKALLGRRPRDLVSLIREVARGWREDRAYALAA